MIRKNNISTSYLDSPLNRSRSKETHKFSKADRFLPEKSYSPNKFYNLPSQLEKRSAGIGYGKKIDLVLKDLNDPAQYCLRSQFDEIANGYRFGLRPQQQRDELKKDYSYNRLKTVDYGYERQVEKKRTPSKQKRNSPTKYDKTPEKSKRTYQKTRTLTQEKEIRRSPLNEESTYKKERKSSHRLKYQFAQNNLRKHHQTSYSQFLNPRRDYRENRENHNKSMIGLIDRNQKKVLPKEEASPNKYYQHPTFGREKRMKQMELLPPAVGPGSYNVFSQFGENLRYY